MPSSRDYLRFLRERVGRSPVILVGTTVFLFSPGGRLLLQRRSDNGLWSCPGGMLEPGEALESAARREVKEETGCDIGPVTLVAVASGPEMFYRYPNGDEVHNVTAIFAGNLPVESEVRAADSESVELRWFDALELPTDLSPPTKVMVETFVRVMVGRLEARP